MQGVFMKNFLFLFTLLSAVLISQACNKPANNNNGQYSFKGGLKINLPVKQFGSIREVPLDNAAMLKQYQQTDPAVNELQAAMYDNFENYAPIGFSYAYTKANKNIFETDTPFGFDNVQDITISGKNCKKSTTLDSEMDRVLTMVSCKEGNQSWDVFFQSFLATPKENNNILNQDKLSALEVMAKMNAANQIIVDDVIKTIEIL